MLRYATISGGVRRFRSSPSTARPRESRATAGLSSLPSFGKQAETRFAVLSTASTPAEAGDDAARALGLRRALAGRPDPLRDPVPRRRGKRALQRPCGQPRHRQAGRRRDRRQARAGRGDERLALVARPECERRLGVHASMRSRTGPRSSTRSTRPAGRAFCVDLPWRSSLPGACPPCACRSQTEAARWCCRSAAAWDGSRSSTRTTFKVPALREAVVARRRPARLRSPSRSPRRPRRCRGWR